MNKKVCLYYLFIAISIPLLMSSVFLALEASHQSIFSIMPSWNDEDFYFNQIKAILEYGHPLGYFGYEGSHAPIGNFGAHGWFILMPYAIFCKIFGLHFNSIAVLNHILLMLAILTYELCFKPPVRKAVLFATMIFSPMLIFYTNTSMMEGENYFWAIMAAVLMAHIAYNEGGRGAKTVLAVIIALAVLSKVTWSVLIFPFMLILLKGKQGKPIVKVIFSGTVTLAGGIIGYIFSSIFAAPYFSGTYFIDRYRNLIADNSIVPGVLGVVKEFIKNFIATFSPYDANWITISVHYILAVAFAEIIFLFIFYKKKKAFSYIPLLVMGESICGILLLYGAGAPAIRNIYPTAVFGIAYILSSLTMEKLKYFVYSVATVFLLGTMIVQSWWGFEPRRWYSAENVAAYAEIEEHMQNIKVDEGAETPWDNTLIISLSPCPDTILELFAPAGVGINYYTILPEDTAGLKAEYILLSNDNVYELQKATNGGYVIIDEFWNAILLKKQKPN